MMHAFGKYIHDLSEGISSTLKGLALTFQHLFEARKTASTNVNIADPGYFSQDKGIVTLQYPYAAIPVPDNGRYRLHNEIDDCIVCDKCAKVCPVNCIDIVPVKSADEIGMTSDGTSKRLYAAVFDIDMAKCCYCGLCTTVCPTECLTMTSTFDYSEFDIRQMNYHFTDLSPEQADEKRDLYTQRQAEKAAAVKKPETTTSDVASPTPPAVFKPKLPGVKVTTEEENNVVFPPSQPAFKPKMPAPKLTHSAGNEPVADASPLANEIKSTEATAKPVFRPKIPGVTKPSEVTTPDELPADRAINESETNISAPTSDPLKAVSSSETENESQTVPAKPVFRPKMFASKPVSSSIEEPTPEHSVKITPPAEETKIPQLTAKPVFRPKIPGITKPAETTTSDVASSGNNPDKTEDSLPVNNTAPTPPAQTIGSPENGNEPAKPKPVFRPKMKPPLPPPPSETSPEL